ncbi:hypothetical protein LPJ75_004569, partial [Coemansia sp. RSA 2598]
MQKRGCGIRALPLAATLAMLAIQAIQAQGLMTHFALSGLIRWTPGKGPGRRL